MRFLFDKFGRDGLSPPCLAKLHSSALGKQEIETTSSKENMNIGAARHIDVLLAEPASADLDIYDPFEEERIMLNLFLPM